MVSRKAKLRTEAPVNGGRNYNGPKVIDRCLSKIWLFAGTSEYLPLLAVPGRAAVTTRGVQTISRKGRIRMHQTGPESSETLRQTRLSHAETGVKRKSELHGDMQRVAEMTIPTMAAGSFSLLKCKAPWKQQIERNSLSGKFRPARME